MQGKNVAENVYINPRDSLAALLEVCIKALRNSSHLFDIFLSSWNDTGRPMYALPGLSLWTEFSGT